MAKRKDYSLDAAPKRAAIIPLPARTTWVVMCGEEQFDLSRWRKLAGRDELILAMCAALNRMSIFASPITICSICRGALPSWFEYLDARLNKGNAQPVTSLKDITHEIIEGFASWLLHRPVQRTTSGRHSYTGARALYSQVKSIWLECIASGGLNPACIPDNPFPGSNRATKSPQPYSREEMSRLLGALGSDLQLIRDGYYTGEQSDQMMIYLLLVAVRTGRNPTPLFEMRRDALQPHPIKPETHALLTMYKRRGNNISVQSFRAPSREVEDMATVTASVATLIYEVCDITAPLVKSAPESIRNNLWLFRSARRDKGAVRCINARNCHEIIKRFVARHALMSDETGGKAKPFQLTFMRLRKTFASRMWAITEGDLGRTATALGNQPRVTDTHYLVATPEMARNHRFIGKCLEIDVRDKNNDPEALNNLAKEMSVSIDEVKRILQGKTNTGVGRCSSPLFGKFAPQTGTEVCTAFLHCFRCPNQVIMGSDLHRLYSFYWLLIKERNILRRNSWHKVYGWVIREIDQVISPRFNQKMVTSARENAKLNPHPMWRDRAMLVSTFGGQNV
ncbi:Uncharacterised protein [Serratia fonticola]|uniref:integrase n=1 Tax=Serratia fonticola TaxID=47917 RepID=UPI0021790E23|nr:integrase [Serratia fonticola]CAI2024964.1 Uncharacterised protein [Serratia fonticola]